MSHGHRAPGEHMPTVVAAAGFGGEVSLPGMSPRYRGPHAGLGDGDVERGASPSPGVSQEGTWPSLWLRPVEGTWRRRLRVPLASIHLRPSALPSEVAWGQPSWEAVTCPWSPVVLGDRRVPGAKGGPGARRGVGTWGRLGARLGSACAVPGEGEAPAKKTTVRNEVTPF